VRLGHYVRFEPAGSQRGTTRCSYATIAARLNAEGVPIAHGAATWWPATVRAVVNAAA
jgi:hypothetical protein